MTVDSYRPPSERAPHPGPGLCQPGAARGIRSGLLPARQPPGSVGHPPCRRRRAPAGGPRGAPDSRGRGQRDRRRSGSRDLSRRRPSRHRELRRRGPDHGLRGAPPHGDDDLGARRLAGPGEPRVLPRPLRRRHARGASPHRRPGRARRLDHRARAVRHAGLRGGRPAGDRVRAGRLPARPVRRPDHRR